MHGKKTRATKTVFLIGWKKICIQTHPSYGEKIQNVRVKKDEKNHDFYIMSGS